jgi:quinol monooxygenase YgiN
MSTHDAVVYEVTLDVDTSLLPDYLPWLDRHVGQMLALPGFTGAQVYAQHEPAPDPGRAVFCVHYRLRDRAALDEYLRTHAARMRADGQQRFGDRFSASRRILHLAGNA